MRINEWHVQICPLQHVWSQTECDENVTHEISRFKQALTNMAQSLVFSYSLIEYVGKRYSLL